MKKALPIVGALLLLVAGYFVTRVFALNDDHNRSLRIVQMRIQQAELDRSHDDMQSMQSNLDSARIDSMDAARVLSNRDTAAAIAGGCALVGIALIVVGLRKRATAQSA